MTESEFIFLGVFMPIFFAVIGIVVVIMGFNYGQKRRNNSSTGANKTKKVNTVPISPQTKDSSEANNYEYESGTTHIFDEKMSEFYRCFSNIDIDGMSKIASEILNYQTQKERELLEIHFICLDMEEKFYRLREYNSEILSTVEAICLFDMNLLPKIKNRLQNVSNPCLTRLCIMYERSGRIEEAMYICDVGQENGMNDNGKSFMLRKERLEKKLAKM